MTETRLSQRGFVWAALLLMACLAPHVARFPWWLSMGLVALVVLRILQRQRRGVAVPKLIRLGLVLGLTLLIGWHYGSLVGRQAGSALLATMLVLKLMESERKRDARLVAVFSLFVLLTQFLFSESLLLTLYVAGCALLIFAGLREFAERRDEGFGWRREALAAWTLRLRPAAAAALMALPLTLLLFVLFPRLGSPLWGAPLDPLAGRTGVSDRMSPGDISLLLADESPAFRVNFLEGSMPPAGQRFWRGPVLLRFDGRSWTRLNYLFNNIEAAEVQVRGAVSRYVLIMEPTEQPWVIALDLPVETEGDVSMGADQVLRTARPMSRSQRFELASTGDYLLEPELRTTWRRLALELPDGFNPRTLALGREWRSLHGSDDAAIVRRALDLFNESFVYSLNPPLLGRDSVDDFLFETQNGFCEHYASAFAVLMRAAGIPTRVVTGYLGGTYNPLGDYWLILQSDAHAWNEVWLEDRGWVRVDPTAAVAPERVLSARGGGADAGSGDRSWLRRLADVGDWIGHQWVSAVLGFNAARQRLALQPFGIPDANWGTLGLVLTIAFAMLSAIWLLFALRVPAQIRDPLRRAWRRLGRRLASAGVPRRPNEGPDDWLRRAARALPEESGALDSLRGRFIALRYASLEPDPDEVDAFRRAVARYRPRARAEISNMNESDTR